LFSSRFEAADVTLTVHRPAGIISFAGFQLDEANARLAAGDQPLELPPKAFAVLCRLAGRPGALVTKDELLDAVWGHRFVSESVLKTAINTIRAALGDDPGHPRYIETVRGRGYRFVAPAGAGTAATASRPASTVSAGGGDAGAPALAPLIGREAALATLVRALAADDAAAPRVLFVAGEAGIGKSVLVEHVAARARALGFELARGHCSEQSGGGEPYLPLLDALAAACAGPRAAAWSKAMRQAAPTWLAQLPWLVAEADRAGLQQELAGAAQDRMLREFAMLLDHVAPERPLLLVIEDLHWSDLATIQLLGYLARRRGGGAPWRVLASFRPADLGAEDHPLQVLRHELRLHRQCVEVALQHFSEADVEALLARRLGAMPEAVSRPLARALHGHTEGLPLFLASVLDELLAGGALARDAAGAWALAPGALDALRVPETVAGIIERRIARLPAELRRLLEIASVLGVGFLHPVLARLVERPAPEVQALCDDPAVRGTWLRPAGMAPLAGGALGFRYAFGHALYQRVFYQRSPPAQRLQHHLAAAQALDALLEGASEAHAAEIARHWECARDMAAAEGLRLEHAEREAVAARVRAAEAAAAVHASADALTHYARALAGATAPAGVARIQIARAGLLMSLGQGPQALQASAAAVATAAPLDEPALRAAAMLCHAEVCVRAERLDEALALTRSLLDTTPPLPAPLHLEAMVIGAEALRTAGRLDEADEVLKAAALAAPPGTPGRLAKIVASRVMIHFQRGTLAEGLPLAEQARALFEQAGDGHGVTAMLTRIGALACLLGRNEEARAALEAALARAQAACDVDAQRGALLNLVKLHTDVGDVDAAFPLLEQGWRLSPDFESPVAECAFLHGYFYCNYLRGHLAAALADASRVMASAARLSAVYWQVGSAVLVFDLYLHLGELVQAHALIDGALAREHVRQVHQQWVKIATRRVWLLLAEGDAAAARAQVAEIDAGGEVGPEEDRLRLAHARAAVQAASGDAAAALAILAPYEGAPTIECWALMLALRLKLHAAGDPAAPALAADIARARAQLEDRRLPALESLLLREALIAALAAQGSDARAERRDARALRQRLADSLDVDPERQHRFLARFAIE
jgi:DNA-binding winged helix-turn-helix (wHTH) protein